MDIMIDLETLGRAPRAVFTQVGWCVFDRTASEIHKSGCIFVDPRSAQREGLELDADTVIWWLRQDKAAQEVMTRDGSSLEFALSDLHNVFAAHFNSGSLLWANSPSFDLAILENALKAVRLNKPWQYWQERDFRTFVSVTEAPKVRPAVAHRAEDDAVAQARTVQAGYALLAKARRAD